MKRIAVIIAAIAVLVGCSKPTPEPVPMPTPEPAPEPQDVQVTLAYTLDASVGNDMTKATNAEVFDIFYQKMKNGELVESSYSLTFTEVATGEVYEYNGYWGSHDMITMRTGKYKVSGTSRARSSYIQYVASLIFDEEIEISASTKTVKLKAAYDCYLLVFEKSNIDELVCVPYVSNYSNENKLFAEVGDYFYAFVNDKIYSDLTEGHIRGTRSNGKTFKIMTGNAAFEKGKYYIYTDVSGSFELPKMEAGI